LGFKQKPWLGFIKIFTSRSFVCNTIQGCWQVLSPTYFPMYFVWWWESFFWC